MSFARGMAAITKKRFYRRGESMTCAELRSLQRSPRV
jgi:hypothetical protein